jgi:[ribosomal protein S5]-alanine N-acetyltransferase
MEGCDWPASTKRLRFGVWREGDVSLAISIWGDPEVTELTGGPFTMEAVAQRLAMEIENCRRYRFQYWPVFQLDGGALVGCCGLRPRDVKARIAELGFQLCRRAWGQGFATEAANGVIEWARERGFAALIAGHHPENLASRRALLRLGFSYTHHELYAPTSQLEPCYLLRIDGSDV